jgi:hypothetical protein
VREYMDLMPEEIKGLGVRIGGRKERLNIISIPEVDPIVSC